MALVPQVWLPAERCNCGRFCYEDRLCHFKVFVYSSETRVIKRQKFAAQLGLRKENGGWAKNGQAHANAEPRSPKGMAQQLSPVHLIATDELV